jgi:Acetyltransferases, including N-acetylases of ribosomal proteins
MYLFDVFPFIENDYIIIRKMTENDIDALSDITNNDNVYRYIPAFLYKKSRGNLFAAIRNLGERDFDKKKHIIAGIFLKSNPEHLIGLAEMFDYKRRTNEITIGYRLNESYWHRRIASNAINLMVDYLTNEIGIQTLFAYVMPENIYSERALLRNGFIKQKEQVEKENWGGQEKVVVDVYTYMK